MLHACQRHARTGSPPRVRSSRRRGVAFQTIPLLIPAAFEAGQAPRTCAPPPVGGTGRRHAFSGASLRFTVLRSHGVGKARPPSIGPRVGSQHNKRGEKGYPSYSWRVHCSSYSPIYSSSTPLTCSRRLVRVFRRKLDRANKCFVVRCLCIYVSWAARSFFFPCGHAAQRFALADLGSRILLFSLARLRVYWS